MGPFLAGLLATWMCGNSYTPASGESRTAPIVSAQDGRVSGAASASAPDPGTQVDPGAPQPAPAPKPQTTPPAAPATPQNPPAAGSDPAFRHAAPSSEELDRMLKSGYATEVRVDRVIVPAVVTDKKGHPVQGLTAADFKLSEDRVPQVIDYFQEDKGAKVSIAFLLDVSGSMRLLDKLGEAREAIRFFLDRLGRGDQASVMLFADSEVQTLAPFGTNPDVILGRLEAVKAYGQTALNDAIAAAPTALSKEQGGRKAIVLITDGIDNASKLSLFEAMSAARRVDVPIYSVGFAGSAVIGTEEPAEGSTAEILKLISNETGGAFFWINDPDEMKEAIQSIEEDLRSEYVLGYTPPQTKCDGSFRRIELKVESERFKVRTRKGYVSGPC